jgi:aspartokinase-like uncharacterized kinase
MNRTVVKVGGSLYDWPPLVSRLKRFLKQLDAAQVWLVPGGGPFADAVRLVDRLHKLGETKSHWLALRSLSLAAEFLRSVLPEWRQAVIDMHEFAQTDEHRPDHLPHLWDVTSDSLAARLALVVGADRLILLKSAEPPESWETSDLVDPYFRRVTLQAPIRIEAINFRTWQPSFPETSNE